MIPSGIVLHEQLVHIFEIKEEEKKKNKKKRKQKQKQCSSMVVFFLRSETAAIAKTPTALANTTSAPPCSMLADAGCPLLPLFAPQEMAHRSVAQYRTKGGKKKERKKKKIHKQGFFSCKVEGTDYLASSNQPAGLGEPRNSTRLNNHRPGPPGEGPVKAFY
ncbi:hypothetical protein HCEG_03121 [Histoplasma capsulatum var. duboisii H88]|uniref:Uncharacterized protein n=1 Tax=Ajellomyces capsulatus (strain H88) TaxID=544711 RepID=F0UBQ7_AJEC8|nr:hypothetical protein HCEG_03121 [Histoplasma capsulatum var. duboisii H88]